MSFESDLFSKAEQAAQTYLIAKRVADSLAAVNTFTGQNAGTKSLPEIIVQAEGPGEPQEPGLEFTGNFKFSFHVIVRVSAAVDGSTASAVKAANDALVQWAFDSMLEDDITTQLSTAIANFTCIALIPQGQNYQPEDENAFSNTLTFQMIACCKTL